MEIAPATIRHWRTRSVWWEDTFEICKLRATEKLEANYNQILQAGSTQMLEKIVDGEETEIGTEEYEVYITEISVDGAEFSPFYWKKLSHSKRVVSFPYTKKIKKKVFERKEIPSRDLNRVLGTIQDKLHLIQGKPTSISEKQENSQDLLNKLSSKLEKISEQQLKNKIIKSIPGEVTQDGGEQE